MSSGTDSLPSFNVLNSFPSSLSSFPSSRDSFLKDTRPLPSSYNSAARGEVSKRLDFVRALLANSAKGAPTACPQACCCVSVSPTYSKSASHISPAFVSWWLIPQHEPDITGHIFSALELAAQHRHTHILQDLGMFCHIPGESVPALLGRGFNARGGRKFNNMLETVFEPEVIAEQLATRESQIRFANYQAAKVFNTLSDSEMISFQISPEPTRYDQVLEDVCPEHREWKESMDEEMRSMERFAVYQRVPKSAAGKRQILGCKWVYRRKRNRLGEVIRYRARLVAQGFRQKAYDSFVPGGTYSPVVHKDTLRLFLAVSASLNLKLFQRYIFFCMALAASLMH